MLTICDKYIDLIFIMSKSLLNPCELISATLAEIHPRQLLVNCWSLHFPRGLFEVLSCQVHTGSAIRHSF